MWIKMERTKLAQLLLMQISASGTGKYIYAVFDILYDNLFMYVNDLSNKITTYRIVTTCFFNQLKTVLMN